MAPIAKVGMLSLLVALTAALPSPSQPEKRGLIGGVVSALGSEATDLASVALAVVDAIETVVPTTTISSFADATAALSSNLAVATNLIDSVPGLIEAGFDPSDISTIVNGFEGAYNGPSPYNVRSPKLGPVYPQRDPDDAPYTIDEDDLRSAIYVPDPFTYGRRPPVVLIPGIGFPGGTSFSYTLGALLANVTFADPVWLNIPNNSLADSQVTAEYVAYAINYVAGIAKSNVTVISFSQGALDAQWAFKYWPSTVNSTKALVALSPGYQGTVLAPVICPYGNLDVYGCTPAVLQQFPNSSYISTLLEDGGDSAYVPTTNIRSATDQLVQPQSGSHPSGVLSDARGVGVSNILVQDTCSGAPAGLLVTHEGMIYNSLAYALIEDVLTYNSTGSVDRLDLEKVCADLVAPGLSLNDLIATEATFALFVQNFLSYLPRTIMEPALANYTAYM